MAQNGLDAKRIAISQTFCGSGLYMLRRPRTATSDLKGVEPIKFSIL